MGIDALEKVKAETLPARRHAHANQQDSTALLSFKSWFVPSFGCHFDSSAIGGL